MARIYLDNHTTTRPSTKSIESMQPYLKDFWGVASAPHSMGDELLPAMQEAYTKIYTLLKAKEADHFVFTSSGAEAVNFVLQSVFFEQTQRSGKNHFLTSALDEACIIMGMERLEKQGCDTSLVAVDKQGKITLEALGDALKPRSVLFSLSWANAMTGTIQPVAQLAQLCRERGVLFHVDATHVLGKLRIDLDEIGPDFVSFNGDHIHAPKGTGGLWIRSGLRVSPLIVGGSEQGGLRAGSVSVALLKALSVAFEESFLACDHVCTETTRLRNLLEEGILTQVKGSQSLFKDSYRLPNTLLIAIPGATSDALLYLLNREGLCASFGGGSYQQLSLQLKTMGFDEKLAHCAISLSLSRYTSQTEIERAIALIAKTAHSLQNLSKNLVCA